MCIKSWGWESLPIPNFLYIYIYIYIFLWYTIAFICVVINFVVKNCFLIFIQLRACNTASFFHAYKHIIYFTRFLFAFWILICNLFRICRFSPPDLAQRIREFSLRDANPTGKKFPYHFLDAASCTEANNIIQADRFFSIKQDALSKNLRWEARFVYLNPPSSQVARVFAPAFVTKMLSEYALHSFHEGIMLVRASTDSLWFQSQILGRQDLHVLFLKTLRFVPRDVAKRQKRSKDTQGRALVYVGKNCTKQDFQDFFANFHSVKS